MNQPDDVSEQDEDSQSDNYNNERDNALELAVGGLLGISRGQEIQRCNRLISNAEEGLS